MKNKTTHSKSREKKLRLDVIVQSIAQLAYGTQCLADRAVKEYTPIVETIICTRCHDTRHIEHTLDGLLDFCFDPKILLIYKKLCRFYYDIDQTAAVSYVNIYREMWDSE